MPTKLEANASFKKPRLVFLVLALALIFSVVFVGGVGGAKIYVSSSNPGNLGTDEYWSSSLGGAISTANSLIGADTIVLTENIVVSETHYITSDITITNSKNTDVTITSDFSYSIFHVDSSGKLTLSGTDSPSHHLTLRGNDLVIQWGDGGAVYVDSGSFVMNDGVTIEDFGLLGSRWAGKAAVYVNSGGEFTMNGGSIENCLSSQGSGVYVAEKGKFNIVDGTITKNGHNGLLFTSSTYGGGVYVEEGGFMIATGEKSLDEMIYGNKGSPQYVYNDPDSTRTYTIRHFFCDINGNNPVENEALRQTAAGNKGEFTNAQAELVPGYIHREITQQTIKDDGSTVVYIYYDISISYKITIPDNLIIAEDTRQGSLTLTPTELWILDTGEVSVSIESQHYFHLAHESDSTIQVSYDLMDGDTIIKQNDKVAGFTLANPNPITLTAEVKDHPPYTGTYNDLLTFTAEYIDPKYILN